MLIMPRNSSKELNAQLTEFLSTHCQFHRHCAKNQHFHCIFLDKRREPCTTVNVQKTPLNTIPETVKCKGLNHADIEGI